MVDRQRPAANPSSELLRRLGGEAKPQSDLFSSMGIVIKKIQRDEKPRSKILPEEVRQAPSVLEPRSLASNESRLPQIPAFQELSRRRERQGGDVSHEAP